jgi:hypothetical protein
MRIRSLGYLVLLGLFLTTNCCMLKGLNNRKSINDNQRRSIVTVFDSGRGTGPNDKMTYAEFESETSITPKSALTVTRIEPDVWYCNGTCGYIAFIRGKHYQYLASQAGSWDGNGYSFSLPDRSLDSAVQMEANTQYLVVLRVWTTKSIGVYTTGNRTIGVSGETVFSTTNSSDLSRGSISFRLVQIQ